MKLRNNKLNYQTCDVLAAKLISTNLFLIMYETLFEQSIDHDKIHKE